MSVRSRRGQGIPFRGENRTANRNIALSACFAASMIACSQAGAEALASRYAVSLSGVRIGEAVVHTTLDAKRYKVEVSADVGMLLNNTKVQGEASGSRSGPKLTPERFHLVTSDGKESAVDFAAAKGAKPDSRLKGLLDPFSALLAVSLHPASASAAPCDKVLPIIMSRARFDASLHPTAREEQSDPRIVTCRISFNGAGGLQNIQWQVGFQKLTKPSLWLVEQLSLPTDMGTVTIDRVETAISGS